MAQLDAAAICETTATATVDDLQAHAVCSSRVLWHLRRSALYLNGWAPLRGRAYQNLPPARHYSPGSWDPADGGL